jgi:starvation-inducible DNA-binding protein
MDKLVQMLRQAFANNFTLYLKSHNYHWTVTGSDFPQYHEFLNKFYDAFQENIDTYAEKLRQIGAYPGGDYKDIVANTQITDPADIVTDPQQIFQNLHDDLDITIKWLQDTYDEAGTNRQYGIQNFLADKIDEMLQFQWMITAILGGE